MDIRVEDNNLSYYNLSSFNNIGGGSLITSIGPYNYNANIKTVTATATSANGGYYNTGPQANTINPNMDYRFTCWVMVTGGTLSTGSVNIRPRTYADVNASYGATPFKDVTNSGSTFADFTPIKVTYLNLSTYCPIGEWRLFSFILRNSGYTGNIDSSDTGIWKPNGTNIGIADGVGDLIMHSGVTLAGITVYNTQSATGTATIYSCYPRIDQLDGTEPSINTLLQNEGMWRSGTTYIKVEDNNLIPYNDWLTGNTTIYNGSYIATNFGTVTQIVEYDEDPFGNTGIVWTHNTISPSSRNGFNTATVDVDINYNYRYSCWVKSTGSTAAYFRLYGRVNGTISGLTNITTGAFNANSDCFAVPTGGYNYSDDEWYLWVGYVRSYTTTGTTNLNESGLYSTNGTKLVNFTDWKFLSNINGTSYRLYIPYNTSGTTVQFIYPRIDKCDGTEPSINTLLTNEGMWRSGTTMIYVDDVWKNTS